jgi:succinate dehydrogenase / fumarate reductase, iron-sulfur subunit
MATFRIKRFNPEKQAEPYFEEFQLDIPEGATLLDCMNLIKWTLDGSFSYRMSCRSAICGSCAVKANGHALLACQRQAAHIVDNDETVTLEPLGNMKPVKDLVVDFTQQGQTLSRTERSRAGKRTTPIAGRVLEDRRLQHLHHVRSLLFRL